MSDFFRYYRGKECVWCTEHNDDAVAEPDVVIDDAKL